MKKIFTFLAFLTLFSAKAQVLTFNEGRLNAYITWLEGPKTGDESKMVVELKSEEPLRPLILSVALFMPDMGHGSSPTKVENISPQQFRVSKIYFTMPGIWEVRVSLKTLEGTKETQKFLLNL